MSRPLGIDNFWLYSRWFLDLNFKNIIAMTAINKITAAKLLVLINLPVLLLIAGVYQIGSAVIV